MTKEELLDVIKLLITTLNKNSALCPDCRLKDLAVMTEEFKKELTSLLNRYGYDTACETPDYILADYVEKCLKNYYTTTQSNMVWHNITDVSLGQKG